MVPWLSYVSGIETTNQKMKVSIHLGYPQTIHFIFGFPLKNINHPFLGYPIYGTPKWWFILEKNIPWSVVLWTKEGDWFFLVLELVRGGREKFKQINSGTGAFVSHERTSKSPIKHTQVFYNNIYHHKHHIKTYKFSNLPYLPLKSPWNPRGFHSSAFLKRWPLSGADATSPHATLWARGRLCVSWHSL